MPYSNILIFTLFRAFSFFISPTPGFSIGEHYLTILGIAINNFGWLYRDFMAHKKSYSKFGTAFFYLENI